MSKFYENITESIWSDIHSRSNGEQVRKEDEMSQEVYDKLDSYLYYYAYTVVSEYAPETLDGLCDYLKNQWGKDSDIDQIIQYVIDNWSDKIADSLSDWVEQAAVDYKKDMNESVWSDIHKRSNGEKYRKEDVNFEFLEGLTGMMKYAIRIASNPKNREFIDHNYTDDCDGFVDYISRRRDEGIFVDSDGNKIPKDEYDKLIKFVEKNWGDCKGINEFSNKIFGSLNECDGVPGGATPANVGGMGAAYFPGPNGEPGSGDLPMPTGHVYHQVAPFGVFIKDLKKKKKKKKFRKEDEPCVYSPNAKVYDYVDDYREYVDRTYNNMDRRK